EGEQIGELLGPAGGAHDIRRGDPVEAGVPFEKGVVPDGRPDVPPLLVDDAPLAHRHKPDRARGRTRGDRGLEVDCGEVQRHTSMLSQASAPPLSARRARLRTVALSLVALTIAIVGLPNVGKSTLFNALTKNSVLAANYPFATIE